MGCEYAQKRRGTSAPENRDASRVPERAFPNSARLDALKSGAMRPSAADKGHRLELRDAMRAKMEQSFGADLSNVKLYESQAVADAGAEAVTQGNEIAFAPGKTDFSSQSGQALLGHELSHVVSQSRGEVTGGGFLADSGLEARADREGAMAARGETIHSGEMNGGAFAPLSTASAAPMAGPMQAKGSDKSKKKEYSKSQMEAAIQAGSLKENDEGYKEAMAQRNQFIESAANSSDKDKYSQRAVLTKELERLQKKSVKNDGYLEEADAQRFSALNDLYMSMKRAQAPKSEYKPFANAGNVSPYKIGTDEDPMDSMDFIKNVNQGSAYDAATDKGREDLIENKLAPKYEAEYKNYHEDIQNPNTGFKIDSLVPNRIMGNMKSSLGEGMSNEQITEMMDNIMSPQKKGEKNINKENGNFDKGMAQLKDMYYNQLKRMEATYGTMGSQMHPRDFMQRGGKEFLEQSHIIQDTEQILRDGGQYFDFENNEKDQEFKRLHHYYANVNNLMVQYATAQNINNEAVERGRLKDREDFEDLANSEYYISPEKEEGIQGPRMSEKEQAAYMQDLQKRAKKEGWKDHLFGRYKKK